MSKFFAKSLPFFLVVFSFGLVGGCVSESTSGADSMTASEKEEAKKAQEINQKLRKQYGVAVPGGSGSAPIGGNKPGAK